MPRKGVDLSDVMAQIGHVPEGHAAPIASDVVELIDDAVDAGELLVCLVLLMTSDVLRSKLLHSCLLRRGGGRIETPQTEGVLLLLRLLLLLLLMI